MAAAVLCWLALFVTPWAMAGFMLVRLASLVEAGRAGRRRLRTGGPWAWKPALLVVAVSLGFVLSARRFALETFFIPAASMTPTLGVGDYVIVDKLSPRWSPPGRGEVVVFRMSAQRDFVKRVVAIGGDRVAVRGRDLFVNGTAVPRRDRGPATYRDRDASTRAISVESVFASVERLGGRSYTVFHFGSESNRSLRDYPRPRGDENRCGGPFNVGQVSRPLTPTDDGTECLVPPGTLFMMGDNRDNSNASREWGAVPVEEVKGRVIGVWMGGIEGMLGRIGRIE
jgi:signal peptidase I